MWTVADALPAWICFAIVIAWLIGMANPSPPDWPWLSWYWKPADAAVSMPITWPELFTSGPPESPDTMFASTSIRPVSVSEEPVASSLAVIDRLSAVTVPGATDGVPPVPPALPMPTTPSPALTFDESPIDAVASPEASRSWMTAMSSDRSYPTTEAA